MPQPPDLRPHPTVNYPGQGPSLPGPNTGIDPLDAPYQPVWQKDQPNGYASLDATGNVPASELGNAGGGVGVQLTAQKDQPNGYAGLDATGNVPASELGNVPALPPGIVTTTTQLAGDVTGTVGATAIANGAVTSAKIPPGAVTSVQVDATVEVVSHKNAANGYAGLDANSMLNESQLFEGSFQRSFESFGGSKTATTIQTTAWAAARAWSDSVGGGTILFGAGTYPHMPAMELGNHQKVRGAGLRTTILQFDASITTGGCIFNHVSTNGTTDGNAYACAVESLAMDCTNLPGWNSGTAASGIVWNQNPQFGTSAVPGDNAEFSDDGMHVIRDVFITHPPQDGVEALAMGGQYWSNVQVYSPGRYGFQPPFDSVIINCIVGFSSKEGFFITGSPVKLVGCKSFAAGNIAPNNAFGQGFHIKAGPVSLVNCEAQDNKAAGIWVEGVGAAPVSITGCILDSNSVRGVGTDPAIDVSGSTNVKITGTICQERRANGTNSFQQNAISLRASSRASISLAHAAVGGAAIGSPFKQIDTGCESTILDVNSFLALQTITYAASYTPDFFSFCGTQEITLTGAITINAPGGGPYPQGARATLILKQDATGGRTITWNAIYVNTPTTNAAANGYTVGNFRFDGTSWIGGA